ncbi:hypothetical protein EV14_1940 [Prochlorococcus sp. MIT 0703]|nr:hypothetical protein EV14_1940 [Prochlorococcus sp. MIT 0703]
MQHKLLDCSCQFNSVAAASSSCWGFCFGLLIRLITSKDIQSSAGDCCRALQLKVERDNTY